MMKYIRWQGIIAFIAITATGIAFWLLLADGLIKKAIEAAGTSAVGAKVELDMADMSLSPLGLTLEGLKVTDPDEPMTNAMEIKRIAFLMDGGRLLMGKVSVDEMAAEGIRLGTPRTTSGAIAGSKEEAAEQDSGASAGEDAEGASMPDINEIIEREGLKTIELAEKVKADIKDKEDFWKAQAKELPDDNTLEGFKQRYKDIKKRLKKGSTKDKIKAANDAGKLNKDIKAAIKELKGATKNLKADYKTLRTDVKAALSAPDEDYKRLKGKYALSGGGLQNATALVFGNDISAYMRKARTIYAKLKPFLASNKQDEPKPVRGKGIDIKFTEHHPAPAFLIKSIIADVELASGQVSGNVRDITSEQAITGKPTTFEFKGSDLKDTASIQFNGEFDHRKADAAKDTVNLSVKEHRINNLTISGSDDLPVSIQSGMADLNVTGRIDNAHELQSTALVKVHSAAISSSPPKDSGKLMAALGRAVSGMSAFTLKAQATGTIDDYHLSLASDIDDVFKAAATDMFKEEAAKYEASLKAAIKEKTSGPLASVSQDMTRFEDSNSAIAQRKDKLESLLKDSSKLKGITLF